MLALGEDNNDGYFEGQLKADESEEGRLNVNMETDVGEAERGRKPLEEEEGLGHDEVVHKWICK